MFGKDILCFLRTLLEPELSPIVQSTIAPSEHYLLQGNILNHSEGVKDNVWCLREAGQEALVNEEE